MRKSYVVVGLAVTVALALRLSVPAGSEPIPAGIAKNRTSAHQLAIACKLYASDHKGLFPARLGDLKPKYLDDLRSLNWQDFSPEHQSTTSMGWLYFGEGFTEKNPPSILIASPQSIAVRHGPIRIVVQGAVTAPVIVEESKCRELLDQTAVEVRLLRDVRAP